MFVWFLSRFGDKEVLNNAKLVSWSPSRCVQWGWGLAGTFPCFLLSCQGRPHMHAASPAVPYSPASTALHPAAKQG